MHTGSRRADLRLLPVQLPLPGCSSRLVGCSSLCCIVLGIGYLQLCLPLSRLRCQLHRLHLPQHTVDVTVAHMLQVYQTCKEYSNSSTFSISTLTGLVFIHSQTLENSRCKRYQWRNVKAVAVPCKQSRHLLMTRATARSKVTMAVKESSIGRPAGVLPSQT